MFAVRISIVYISAIYHFAARISAAYIFASMEPATTISAIHNFIISDSAVHCFAIGSSPAVPVFFLLISSTLHLPYPFAMLYFIYPAGRLSAKTGLVIL